MNFKLGITNNSLLVTTLITAATAVLSTTSIAADTISIQDIAQIAKKTSVQINTEGDVTPGGSGVIIAKQGNRYSVLTANHVVCDIIDRPGKILCAKDITYSVRTNDGKEYPIKSKDIVVLQSTKNDPDLALVSFVATQEYATANLGDSDQMTEASDVFVGGFPAVFTKIGSARDFSFTKGIVLSRGRTSINGYSLIYDAITLTGNSGGPVFDIKGRVVGIHGLADTSNKSKTETGEIVSQKTGFNAGIPINTFLNFNNPLLKELPIQRNTTATGEVPQQRLNSPQSARDFYARGITKLDQFSYKESLDDFDQAIKIDPKYAEAYFKRGYALSWLRRYEEALLDFNQVIALDPNYLDGYLNRGWTYIWLQNDQAALEDFNRAIRLNPSYSIAYAHQGMAYIKLGKYQAALESSKQAIRLDPNNSYGYTIQSDVFNYLKDYAASIKVSTLAIIIDPDDFNAYINRATAYTLTGNFSAALVDYQKSAEIFERRYTKKPSPATDNSRTTPKP
ncbi:MAG: tetratricopeptide repeat protein [Cyanobacteria bacterium REEB494]|uniref:tetratricopeptide repeat-containing serine protease family protein n=1 Tax=Cylindrospermopsis raciborskii TaxID=77022 RepID=UPI002ED92B66|nr:tetratricopeptide repeat protein [Cyanobacteria bacterium REEB494]